MRTTIEEVVERYQDSLYVAAFSITKNAQDAEDVVQDTYLAYYTKRMDYADDEHVRAWLLRVAINKAKNVAHSFWRRNGQSLTEETERIEFSSPEGRNLFEAVMALPENCRAVIHLFYYEDYSVKEIAQLLKLSESNVKVRLSRGRAQLKKELKEGWLDDE